MATGEEVFRLRSLLLPVLMYAIWGMAPQRVGQKGLQRALATVVVVVVVRLNDQQQRNHHFHQWE